MPPFSKGQEETKKNTHFPLTLSKTVPRPPPSRATHFLSLFLGGASRDGDFSRCCVSSLMHSDAPSVSYYLALFFLLSCC